MSNTIRTIEQEHTPVVKEVKKEQRKEMHLHGSMKIHKGHTLFEINLATKELNYLVVGEKPTTKKIKKAEFEEVPFNVLSKNKGVNKRVIMKDDCVYIPALNENNAIRKLLKKVDERGTKRNIS